MVLRYVILHLVLGGARKQYLALDDGDNASDKALGLVNAELPSIGAAG